MSSDVILYFWDVGICRVVEGFLKRVNKLFGEFRVQNEDMEKDFQQKLVEYKNKFDDVWDLLREVIDKIRDVNRLFVVN